MALYDPQEFPAETRTDFSLSEILAWARMKPADEAYRFSNIRGCALFQFLSERGLPVAQAGVTGWLDHDDNWHDIGEGEVLEGGVLSRSPTTFGAFADRLEKALAA
jgi:hypothetical protein